MEFHQFTKDILTDLDKSQKYCYKLYQNWQIAVF